MGHTWKALLQIIKFRPTIIFTRHSKATLVPLAGKTSDGKPDLLWKVSGHFVVTVTEYAASHDLCNLVEMVWIPWTCFGQACVKHLSKPMTKTMWDNDRENIIVIIGFGTVFHKQGKQWTQTTCLPL